MLFLKELQGWSLDETIGKLHRFWWWCLDFATDGRLEKYNHAVIAGSIGIPPDQAAAFIQNMITAQWLDAEPCLRIHDWLDYAGRYLRDTKYKHAPEKWQAIAQFYGRKVEDKRPKAPVPQKPAPQVVTVPAQQAATPKPVRKAVNPEAEARFEEFWKLYPDRSGKKIGKAKTRTLFLALTDEEQIQCIGAVKEYARHCQQAERTPKDPFRFLKSQDGEIWRDFIPQERPIRPVPKPVPKVEMVKGEPPPQEAQAILDRIRSGIGKPFPGARV